MRDEPLAASHTFGSVAVRSRKRLSLKRLRMNCEVGNEVAFG